MLTSFDQVKNNLTNHIAAYVILNYPTKNGSMGSLLEYLKKTGKRIPEMIDGQQVPKTTILNSFEEWIMLQWNEIGQSRINNDSGAQPITDTQILAYMQLTDTEYRLIDIKLIKDIDRAFIGELATQRDLNKE